MTTSFKEAQQDYKRFTSHDFREVEHFIDQVYALATYPADQLREGMLKKLKQAINISFNLFLDVPPLNTRTFPNVLTNIRHLSSYFNYLESHVDALDGLSNYPRLLKTLSMSYRVIKEKLESLDE